MNKDIFESCRNRAGIYTIWQCVKNQKEVKYIGQTVDSTSLMRILNHFVSKHENTGSQLVKLKTAAWSGAQVGLVFVEIKPKEPPLAQVFPTQSLN